MLRPPWHNNRRSHWRLHSFNYDSTEIYRRSHVAQRSRYDFSNIYREDEDEDDDDEEEEDVVVVNDDIVVFVDVVVVVVVEFEASS